MMSHVFDDGRDAGSELAAAGHTWVYPRYCRAAVCGQHVRAEESARGSPSADYSGIKSPRTAAVGMAARIANAKQHPERGKRTGKVIDYFG